jgi:hypothetical protein
LKFVAASKSVIQKTAVNPEVWTEEDILLTAWSRMRAQLSRAEWSYLHNCFDRLDLESLIPWYTVGYPVRCLAREFQ